MRKILISAMLLSSVAISAPAAAQYRGGGWGHQGANIERQLDQLEQQIDRLHDRYRRNGLSAGEHRDLQMRIQNLRQRVQAERREGRFDDRRDDRRDRW